MNNVCLHENIEYFFSMNDCNMEITKCCSDCLVAHDLKLEGDSIFTQEELKEIYDRNINKR